MSSTLRPLLAPVLGLAVAAGACSADEPVADVTTSTQSPASSNEEHTNGTSCDSNVPVIEADLTVLIDQARRRGLDSAAVAELDGIAREALRGLCEDTALASCVENGLECHVMKRDGESIIEPTDDETVGRYLLEVFDDRVDVVWAR